MSKILELEKELNEVNKKSQEIINTGIRLSKELQELKLSAKEEEFKVGDYLIQTKNFVGQSSKEGAISILTAVDKEYYYLDWLCDKSNGQMNGAYNKNGLRKATVEEIEKHLISEAEKKGFVKGAKAKSPHLGEFTIYEIAFRNYGGKSDEINIWSSPDECRCFLDSAELIPSHPSIVIGGEYNIEFKEDYINIGCKTIPSHEIINLNHALKAWNSCKQSHGEIECVQINGYEISVKQIEEIAKHYNS